MLTAGLDLATDPVRTASARIEWMSSRAVLRELRVGVDDSFALELIASAECTGVDCPLGWPDAFVEFLAAHRNDSVPPDRAVALGARDGRRDLANRLTDVEVGRRGLGWPLSVSTDKLGLVAFRAAGLLARLREQGAPVDRSGHGAVVEVYPAASLRAWGVTAAASKRDAAGRAALVAALEAAAPWLELGEHRALCLESHDAFDAVVAALCARAAATGRASRPRPDQLDQARREGWIALPEVPLADLLRA